MREGRTADCRGSGRCAGIAAHSPSPAWSSEGHLTHHGQDSTAVTQGCPPWAPSVGVEVERRGGPTAPLLSIPERPQPGAPWARHHGGQHTGRVPQVLRRRVLLPLLRARQRLEWGGWGSSLAGLSPHPLLSRCQTPGSGLFKGVAEGPLAHDQGQCGALPASQAAVRTTRAGRTEVGTKLGPPSGHPHEDGPVPSPAPQPLCTYRLPSRPRRGLLTILEERELGGCVY